MPRHSNRFSFSSDSDSDSDYDMPTSRRSGGRKSGRGSTSGSKRVRYGNITSTNTNDSFIVGSYDGYDNINSNLNKSLSSKKSKFNNKNSKKRRYLNYDDDDYDSEDEFDDNNGSDSMSGLQIVGIIILALALLVLIAFLGSAAGIWPNPITGKWAGSSSRLSSGTSSSTVTPRPSPKRTPPTHHGPGGPLIDHDTDSGRDTNLDHVDQSEYFQNYLDETNFYNTFKVFGLLAGLVTGAAVLISTLGLSFGTILGAGAIVVGIPAILLLSYQSTTG